MTKFTVLLLLFLTYSVDIYSQNLVFVGENSYQSTEIFTLQTNTDGGLVGDLELVFAKDGANPLIIVRSKLVRTVRISGKLIIYLEDGSVITCVDKGIKDNVDDIAITAYYLTSEEVEKMKESNIHTVRYAIKCFECSSNPLYEGNYSASNKGRTATDYTKVINGYFNRN